MCHVVINVLFLYWRVYSESLSCYCAVHKLILTSINRPTSLTKTLHKMTKTEDKQSYSDRPNDKTICISTADNPGCMFLGWPQPERYSLHGL